MKTPYSPSPRYTVLATTPLLLALLDPKADTMSKKLEIISPCVRSDHSVAPAVKSLVSFLGLR